MAAGRRMYVRICKCMLALQSQTEQTESSGNFSQGREMEGCLCMQRHGRC